MPGRHGLLLLLFLSALVPPGATHALSVTNSALLKALLPADRSTLESQGMVACLTTKPELLDIYEEVEDEPVFVTTDLPLHIYHVLFDFALRDAERDYFYPAVETMLRGLVVHQSDIRKRAGAGVVGKAAEENIAFLSVPLAVLDSAYVVPGFASARVRAELTLIERAAGQGRSPTTGIEEDYTQYKPRGHYTISERLQRYFKAMMFLGRMVFYLNPDGDASQGIGPTRRALLLCDAFRAGPPGAAPTYNAWLRVYEPTAWMVGRADDLLPIDYVALLDRLRAGSELTTWVADSRNISAFIAAARELPDPRILSTTLYYTQPLSTTKGMRLMGQRFLIDSYVFGELVYPQVGVWPDSARLLPRGLDVMAALGSKRARHHLLETHNDDRFRNYVEQLDKVTDELASLTKDDWRSTAFLAWLYALKLNLEPVSGFRTGTAVPRFVRSEAYADKSLMTACGSWAELRRDVLLYSKQPYVMFGGVGPEPPEHQAYVEPKPRVFLQVARMADELKRQLAHRQVAREYTLNACGILAEASRSLARMAQLELDGTDLSEDDVEYCHDVAWRFGRALDELARAWTTDDDVFGLDAEPQPMAVIADVVTDPNRNQILEVAVGDPCRLYALIPFYGRTYLAIGACFSYYEFANDASSRMTDEEWRALTPRPPMPAWTRSIVRQ